MSHIEEPRESKTEDTQIDQKRTIWTAFIQESNIVLVLGLFFLLFIGIMQLADVHNQMYLRETKRSAARGDINAQQRLAILYHEGIGAEIDYLDAAHLMEKAARAGYPGAQAHMGALHYLGLGVLEDDRAALCWYARSAVQGDLTGAIGLATMYLTGRGVEKSPKKAYAWMNLGNRTGNPKVREVQRKLRGTLNNTGDAQEAQVLSRLLLDRKARITELKTTGCNSTEDLSPLSSLTHRGNETT